MNKPTDQTTGLDQLGARQYDPTTGRFITVDPDVNQTQQPYTYAGDNPVTRADPTGLHPEDPGTGGSCPQTVCGGGSNTNGPPPTTSDNPNAPGSASPPTGTQGTYGGGNGSWGEQRIDNNTPSPQHHGGGILHAVGAFVTGAANEVYGATNALTGGALGPNLGNNYCSSSSVGGGSQSAYCTAGAFFGGVVSGVGIVISGVDEATGSDIISEGNLADLSGSADGNTAGDLAFCGGQSFTATTQVRLADGTNLPIDQVRVGDNVLATDAETGKTQPELVTALWVNHDTDLLDLTVHTASGDTVIDTTQHHLFYDLTTHTWVQARNLHPGDRLHTADGQPATVAGSVIVPGAADMWDLTVNHDHDFYIDTLTTAVLVHNCSEIPSNAQSTLETIDQTGRPPSGYQGGGPFLNDGRDGGQILPQNDSQGNPVTYQEWDTNPFHPGVNRGQERIVTGSDQSAYYTDNHYKTFILIRPGQ